MMTTHIMDSETDVVYFHLKLFAFSMKKEFHSPTNRRRWIGETKSETETKLNGYIRQNALKSCLFVENFYAV